MGRYIILNIVDERRKSSSMTSLFLRVYRVDVGTDGPFPFVSMRVEIVETRLVSSQFSVVPLTIKTGMKFPGKYVESSRTSEMIRVTDLAQSLGH